MEFASEMISLIQDEFGYPVYIQGSFGENDPYPPAFFTYWEWAGGGLTNYDNTGYSHYHEFDLNFFSNDAQLCNDIIDAAIKILKNNDYQMLNYGRNRASNVPGWIGKGVSVTKMVYEML